MKSEKKEKTNLVWLDMEMTGLEPEENRIIEMATIITDSELNILEEGPNLVIHQPDKILEGMDKWNQKHHKKSGLIDAVKASTLTVRKAEKLTLDFIKKHVAEKKAPLCGNSIHHDRRFLVRYMPALNDYIHYRHIDVSSIKSLISRWYPEPKDRPKKGQSHRALADIRESIEELKYYRKKYFKKTVKA